MDASNALMKISSVFPLLPDDRREPFQGSPKKVVWTSFFLAFLGVAGVVFFLATREVVLSREDMYQVFHGVITDLNLKPVGHETCNITPSFIWEGVRRMTLPDSVTAFPAVINVFCFDHNTTWEAKVEKESVSGDMEYSYRLEYEEIPQSLR